MGAVPQFGIRATLLTREKPNLNVREVRPSIQQKFVSFFGPTIDESEADFQNGRIPDQRFGHQLHYPVGKQKALPTSPQPRLRRRRDILAHKPESRNSSNKWLRKTGQVSPSTRAHPVVTSMLDASARYFGEQGLDQMPRLAA